MVKASRGLFVESLETRRLLTALPAPFAPNACTAESISAVEEATLQVGADNVSGLRAAEFRFRYDTTTVDIDPSSVKAGAAWQGKASVVTKVNDAAGIVNVFIFSANPVAFESGELVKLDLEIEHQLAEDIAAQVELTKFEMNEGQIDASAKLMIEQHGVGTDAGMIADHTSRQTDSDLRTLLSSDSPPILQPSLP